jgi:ArsR family transcriptional regulator
MLAVTTPPELFKSLADETRARMTFLILMEAELCVCELVWALNESQPKISRHLAQLRKYGLLADRRQGQWVYYHLHPALPEWIRLLLQTALDANREWIQADLDRLNTMGERPERKALCC